MLAWAAFAPVTYGSRDEVFRIPSGTWARRMAGEKLEILPSTIRLTLGIRDVLVLENHDDVPQQFGPTLMMPGQSFRLPFSVASDYQFACTAHASGQMTIVVDPVSRDALGTARLARASPLRRGNVNFGKLKPALPSIAVIAVLIAAWWVLVVQTESVVFPTPGQVDHRCTSSWCETEACGSTSAPR